MNLKESKAMITGHILRLPLLFFDEVLKKGWFIICIDGGKYVYTPTVIAGTRKGKKG